jgi:muramoyltetrapeptide carboxypeptidase
MFLDREVKVIWAARGGSGCIHLLSKINYSLIRNNPKILIGYSDITALLLAIYRLAGLVTFHGPVASSTFSDYSAAHLKAVLMEPQSRFAINMSPQHAEKALQEPQFARRTIREGVATGQLVGGNLSVLSALVGTPYAAELRDSLLFLEEIGEAPYRIDRMLTQLSQSGGLKNIAGAMLGVFQKSVATDGEPSLTLAEVLDDHFAQLKTPSVYGFSFGHIAQQFTIPVGVRARLDTANATLTLLEAAVQ